MPALVAGIHAWHLEHDKAVDGRDKPGHDGAVVLCGLGPVKVPLPPHFPFTLCPGRDSLPPPFRLKVTEW